MNKSIFALALVVLVGGGAYPTQASEPVQKLTVKDDEFPDALTERVRSLGNEVYPKIAELLQFEDLEFREEFKIVIDETVSQDKNRPGRTYGNTTMSGSKITLAGGLLANDPMVLDFAMVHELAHVAQGYGWWNAKAAPDYWIEGIASYAAFKLGYADEKMSPCCDLESPNYTFGYRCAGAFLLYLDERFGVEIVRKLNWNLKERSYSNEFFMTETGYSLADLWKGFMETKAYLPSAKSFATVQDKLGVQIDASPRVLRSSIDDFVDQYSGTSEYANVLRPGFDKLPEEVQMQVLANYEFQQSPEGTLYLEAVRFLGGLAGDKRLPGLQTQGKPKLSIHGPSRFYDTNYPVTVTVRFDLGDDSELYVYTARKADQSAAWQLVEGQRSSATGEMISIDMQDIVDQE